MICYSFRDDLVQVVWKGDELWLQTDLGHFCDRGVAKKSKTQFFMKMTRGLRSGSGSEASGSQPEENSQMDQTSRAGPLSPSSWSDGWIELRNWTQVSKSSGGCKYALGFPTGHTFREMLTGGSELNTLFYV